VLIQSVESAIISAARKALFLPKKDRENIEVRLDANTGEIRVFFRGKELKEINFGRIAAQTARQVIIQKFREAEKDIIYNEFLEKKGDIISGSVHRFSTMGVIVDLGRTEGFLPSREIPPKENYKQGMRFKAYILDVKRTHRGPWIILSRSHPGLVRRLFELEVPEIYEGIVEIKAVAREAGERTKIAVFSNDEKVDCVGACVGVRGSRVKNIVRELRNERIDIVRWSEDISDFVSAGLSPAEIAEVKVYKEERKVVVFLEEDQLSLAIGKNGQNVRLASRLVGWNIDVRRKKEAKKVEISLTEIPGIGPRTADILRDAGLDSLDALSKATIADLTNLHGIGEKLAKRIIGGVREKLEAE